jgi:hypothetical protein
VRSLKRRRTGADLDALLVYRSGQRWHDVTAAGINDYLRDAARGEFTAKDFRTWHATVLAAVGLAVSQPAAEGPSAARKRAIARVVKEVAGYLANTPHGRQPVAPSALNGGGRIIDFGSGPVFDGTKSQARRTARGPGRPTRSAAKLE